MRSINLKKFELSQSFRISWEDADKRFMQIVSNVVASKTLEERNLILKNDFETFRIKIKFSLAQDFQIRIGTCSNDKTFPQSSRHMLSFISSPTFSFSND